MSNQAISHLRGRLQHNSYEEQQWATWDTRSDEEKARDIFWSDLVAFGSLATVTLTVLLLVIQSVAP
jgi:hypothetical protein